MDKWMNGRLEQEIKKLYEVVRAEALSDNAKWGAGNVDVGVRQLLTEWIPLR